jgi:hypothetical protein
MPLEKSVTSCQPDESSWKDDSIHFDTIYEPLLHLKVLQDKHTIEQYKSQNVDPLDLVHGAQTDAYQKDCLDASPRALSFLPLQQVAQSQVSGGNSHEPPGEAREVADYDDEDGEGGVYVVVVLDDESDRCQKEDHPEGSCSLAVNYD